MNYKVLLSICITAVCGYPLISNATALCKDNGNTPPCLINAAVEGGNTFLKQPPQSENISCTYRVISNSAKFSGVLATTETTEPKGYQIKVDYPYSASMTVESGIIEVVKCKTNGNHFYGP